MSDEPPNGAEDEREPVARRSHDTYKKDHWTVVDIDDVDKVFATAVGGPGSHPRRSPQVRVDVDGFIAKSVMNDVGEADDDVSTSIWLTVPDALELLEHLSDAVEEAKNRDDPETGKEPSNGE